MIDLEGLLKSELPKKSKGDDNTIENRDIHNLLKGEYVDPEKLVYKITSQFPIDYCEREIPEIICRYSKIEKTNLEDTLFIDTETTGLTGGTGTYTFLVGCGYVRANNFIIHQYFMKDPAGEETLVNSLLKLFENFNCMLTFNGKSFDIPLLKTRFTFHSFFGKLDHYRQIDLLHLARRLWRNKLGSCNLQNLEDKVLQIHRDLNKEIPGSEIPWVYFDYLDSKEATFITNVINHNEADIYNMFLLFQQISRKLTEDNIDSNSCPPDYLEIARLWEEFWEIDVAIRKMEKLLELNYEKKRVLKRLSNLYKVIGDYDRAVDLWLIAADLKQVYAFEELAKYYEHQEKNLIKALYFTEKAINYLETEIPFESKQLESLYYRKKRLVGKSERT